MQQGAGHGPYVSRLRADSRFFLELQFCNEHGIPHSYFLGADAPRWKRSDRAKALAFIMEKAQRCVMCGTAPWEWDENRFAYEPVTRTCRGCYVKDTLAADKARQPGMTVELRPSIGVEAAKRRVAEQRVEARRRAKK